MVKNREKLYRFFTDSFTGGEGGGWTWLDQVGLGWTGLDSDEPDKSDGSDEIARARRAKMSGANIGLVFHGLIFLVPMFSQGVISYA